MRSSDTGAQEAAAVGVSLLYFTGPLQASNVLTGGPGPQGQAVKARVLSVNGG